MSFFVTLPSTSSVNIYPSNEQTDYTVKLPQTIHLTGQNWTVGLAEIHIPTSWYNVDDSNDTFCVKDVTEIDVTETKIDPPVNVMIPPGNYKGFNIYKVLNTALRPYAGVDKTVIIEVDKSDPITVKVITGTDIRVQFPNTLWVKTVFGLTDDEIDKPLNSFDKTLSKAITAQFPTVNIKEPYNIITIHNIRPELKQIKKLITKEAEVKIPSGRYESHLDLFKQINDNIPDYHKRGIKQRIHIRLLPSNQTKITTHSSLYFMFRSNKKGLGEMLGFDTFDEYLQSAVSNYPFDLKRGLTGIFVYTDLIQPQFVGDTYAPLLRVINTSMRTSNNESIAITFDQTDYYPLSYNTFETIRIYLRTDDGQPLAFKYGKVLVKLHFKLNRENNTT